MSAIRIKVARGAVIAVFGALLGASSPLPAAGQDATPGVPPAAATNAPAWPSGIPSDLDRRVNRALGRILASKPPIHPAVAVDVAAAIERDQRAALSAGGLAPDAIDSAIAMQGLEIALTAPRMVAYYSHTDKAILLQDAALDALVARKAVEPGDRARVVALLVAHELAHALQDQEVGLATFLAARGAGGQSIGAEARWARRAVAEGQAMLAEELVAKELVAEDPAWTAAASAVERIAPGALGADSGNGQPALGDKDRYREELIYRGGLNRLRAVHAMGGASATWAMFADPPSNLSAFERGADGFDPVLSDAMAKALDQFPSVLGPQWTGKAKASTPMVALSTQLAAMPPEARERLVAACRGVAAMAAIERGSGRAPIIVFRARDEDGAALLYGELGAMNAKAMRLLGITSPERTEIAEAGLAADIARHQLKLGQGQTTGISFTRIRRGPWVAQLSLVNADRSADELRRIATILLDNVSKAESPSAPGARDEPAAPPPPSPR